MHVNRQDARDCPRMDREWTRNAGNAESGTVSDECGRTSVENGTSLFGRMKKAHGGGQLDLGAAYRRGPEEIPGLLLCVPSLPAIPCYLVGL
jgi:hypothetical protein